MKGIKEGDNLATDRVRLTPPLLRGFEAYTLYPNITHFGQTER